MKKVFIDRCRLFTIAVLGGLLVMFSTSAVQAEQVSFTITGEVHDEDNLLNLSDLTFTAIVYFDTEDFLYGTKIRPVTMVFRLGDYTVTNSQMAINVDNDCTINEELLDHYQIVEGEGAWNGQLAGYSVDGVYIHIGDYTHEKLDEYYDECGNIYPNKLTEALVLEEWTAWHSGEIVLKNSVSETSLFITVYSFELTVTEPESWLSVSEAWIKWESLGSTLGTVNLKADFGPFVPPSADDLVMVVCDGITLFSSSFKEFSNPKGYSYILSLDDEEPKSKVKFDFSKQPCTLSVAGCKIDLPEPPVGPPPYLDNSNGVNVRLYIGNHHGVENILMQAKKLEYERP